MKSKADYSKELGIAVKAAKTAGCIILKHYGKTAIEYKADLTSVTEADKKAEKAIIRIIKTAFPAHSIIAEESGKQIQRSRYAWIIDPLDGTNNFTMMNPFFNTSIALLKDDEPCLGVVYFPIQKELFTVVKGHGAFLNGKPIKPSTQSEVSKARIGFCHGGRTRELIKRATCRYVRLKEENCKIRQLGSAALELAYVAAGRLDAFWMTNINLWDIAAGVLLVQEAGGMVTDFKGKPYTQFVLGDIIASNKALHKKLLPFLNHDAD